jgi:hypothetical protein
MTILNSNGYVGIGTTAPSMLLDVNGAVKANSLTLVSGLSSYSTNNLYLRTNGTDRITILNSNGYVGIGTTTPSAPLEVKGKAIVDGDLQVGMSGSDVGEGKRLYFLGAYENTDQLWIARYNHSLDITDLRVNIGDNRNDYDRFVLGCTRGTGVWEPFFVATAGGKVGINVENPQNALDVNGTIHAKEVKIDLTGWPDYVFSNNYKLPALNELKLHIDENKHLPGIPTEMEVQENGVNLGEMQVKLLQKIEELTLYAIQQQEMIDRLNAKIEKIENEKK